MYIKETVQYNKFRDRVNRMKSINCPNVLRVGSNARVTICSVAQPTDATVTSHLLNTLKNIVGVKPQQNVTPLISSNLFSFYKKRYEN